MPEQQDTDTSAGRAKRDSIFMLAEIMDANGKLMDKVRVRNLSATGMMAESQSALREGDAITIVLRGIGDVAGRITWVRGGKIGVSFDTEIDPQAARRPVGAGQPKAGSAPVARWGAPVRPG
jgi:hypothetical protein